jgi:hypothetical protein
MVQQGIQVPPRIESHPGTSRNRQVTALIARCYAGLDAAGLRAALIAKKRCGGVMCLHRENSPHGFDVGEVDLVRRISPHVAEGLRRAISIRPAAAVTTQTAAPGIIVLDANLAVVSMSPEAQQWLAEIDDADWPGPAELPTAIYATAAGLARLHQGPDAARPSAVRLRSRTAAGGCPCMPPRGRSSGSCTSQPTRSKSTSPGRSTSSASAAAGSSSPPYCPGITDSIHTMHVPRSG